MLGINKRLKYFGGLFFLLFFSFSFFTSCAGEAPGPASETNLPQDFCQIIFSSAPKIDELSEQSQNPTENASDNFYSDTGEEFQSLRNLSEDGKVEGRGDGGLREMAKLTGKHEANVTGKHNQGKNCLSCHSSGEHRFTIGGTIFKNLKAPDESVGDAAEGYTVELITRSCKSIVANKGNGSGNFHMNYNLTEDYIPFVLDQNGKRVNRSSAIHPSSRQACNSCHTKEGTNGAPGRIVSYDYYSSITGQSGGSGGGSTSGGSSALSPSFKNDVHPILTQKCMGCHKQGGQAGGTRYILQGDAEVDYNTIMQNKLVVAGNPNSSLLLQKPSGKTSHGGGIVLPENSQEYNTIKTWIEQGAKF